MLTLEARDGDQTQASANELYRHAAYSALVALSPSAAATGAGSTAPGDVWNTLDGLWPQLGCGVTLSPRLNAGLRQGSLAYFGALPAEEQRTLGSELRQLVETLLARAEAPERRLEALCARRVWRVLLLVGLLIGAGVGGVCFYRWQPDLAAGKPWGASSTLGPASGCLSPAQECGLPLGLFFHTAEEQDPWLEVDLQRARRVSGVELQNRQDCCADRAQPIAVEVSTDHEHWRTVAYRKEEFSIWNASFAPVEARWVRFRVLKRTYFHLKRARIF